MWIAVAISIGIGLILAAVILCLIGWYVAAVECAWERERRELDMDDRAGCK